MAPDVAPRRAWLRHLLLALILAGALALALIVGRRPDEAPAPAAEAPPSAADVRLARIDYTETRDGRPVWQLQADAAEHQREADLTRVRNLRMIFFDAAGAPQYRLRADEGLLQQGGRQVEVWGEVEVDLAGGQRCRTERLHFDAAADLLTTDAPVRIEADGWQITGRGLEYVPTSGRLTLRSEVAARLQLELNRRGAT